MNDKRSQKQYKRSHFLQPVPAALSCFFELLQGCQYENIRICN